MPPIIDINIRTHRNMDTDGPMRIQRRKLQKKIIVL